MGSTLMLRICQKPLKAFFNHGLYVCTNTPMCKWQSSLPARSLCTKESVSTPHGRHRNKGSGAHGGAKRSNIRHPDEKVWDAAMTGRGKPPSFVRQTPAFPKSVFAAGTAKRTAEMLRRKSALQSQDEDQVDVEDSRGLPARGASRAGKKTLI